MSNEETFDGFWFLPCEEEGLNLSFFSFKDEYGGGTPIGGNQLGDNYHLAFFRENEEGLPEFDHASIEAALRAALIDGLGLKPKVAFGPVRVAVTGSRISPPLFESMELLGRERSTTRLAAALAVIPAS